jgi:hypothetical protein
MLSSAAVNAIGLVLAAWASWSRPRGATPGNGCCGLAFATSHRSFDPASKSLARNRIKIALPWELGHSVALSNAHTGTGNVPISLWPLATIIYGWLLINLILLIMPSGRPLHDWLAGTVVVRTGS